MKIQAEYKEIRMRGASTTSKDDGEKCLAP